MVRAQLSGSASAVPRKSNVLPSPQSLRDKKKLEKLQTPTKTTTNSSVSSPLIIPRPKKKPGLVLFYPEKAIMSLKKNQPIIPGLRVPSWQHTVFASTL